VAAEQSWAALAASASAGGGGKAALAGGREHDVDAPARVLAGVWRRGVVGPKGEGWRGRRSNGVKLSPMTLQFRCTPTNRTA
jgi:hypothetical protein